MVGITWLPQRQPDAGVALLRDYPAEVVSIECDTCGWVDQYRLVALVTRFGPAAKLSDVLFVLSTDCPRQQDLQFTEPCIASFPKLVESPEQTTAATGGYEFHDQPRGSRLAIVGPTTPVDLEKI